MPSTIAPTKMIDAYAATILKGPTMVMGGSLGSTLGHVTRNASKTFPAQKVRPAVSSRIEPDGGAPTWLKNFE
jgi:hypothetical protein